MPDRIDIIERGNHSNNDKFYRGFAGETFLVAGLMRRRYDAFKLPVDYGFDVCALSRRNAAAAYGQPVDLYYFQVKTLYVSDARRVKVKAGKEMRTVAAIPLSLKKDTIELMRGDLNKALVVYIYDEARQTGQLNISDSPTLYFWINGRDLAAIEAYCPTQPKREDYVTLTVNVVYPPAAEGQDEPGITGRGTYLAFGQNFCRQDPERADVSQINADMKEADGGWLYYHSINDGNGKYFNLDGFFEECPSLMQQMREET